MAVQNILVLVGIVLMFTTFIVVVAWADFYTRGAPKPGRNEPSTTKKDTPDWNDEKRAA